MTATVIQFPERRPEPTLRFAEGEMGKVIQFPNHRARPPSGPKHALHPVGTMVRFVDIRDLLGGRRSRHSGRVCEIVDAELKIHEGNGRRRYFKKYTLFDLSEKDHRYQIFRCEDGSGSSRLEVVRKKGR